MKPIKGEWYKIMGVFGDDGKEVVAQFDHFDTGSGVYFCTFQKTLNKKTIHKYYFIGLNSLEDLEHII